MAASRIGTLLNGEKIPALAASRIAWQDGVAGAALVAGQFTPLAEVDAADNAAIRAKLLRHASAQSGHRHSSNTTRAPQVSDGYSELS